MKNWEDSLSPQEKDIVAYIRRNGSITFLEAITIGCGRLSARVCDMRKMGAPIKSELVIVKNRKGEDCRVARYWLAA